METTFLIIVGVLILLAITDLVVGVSNDAVNFLNSAIGAKVAPRSIIMLVAASGIFIGATFSSGMMEIARKGIFNPEFFMFSDIMMIFLAVMLSDIILLDLFNSLGLPTSTTVSIVFELLGAAVVLAFFKTIENGAPIEEVSIYINSSKAVAIVIGILLSVFIAFSVGAVVQFISRWIFSFQYEKRLKYFGAVWTGLAMTALTYFLLLKGLKGSSFATPEFVALVKENNLMILLASFLLWTVIMQIFISVLKWNILRFVVLFGTFALAMAFAGNDLVNFVGVPLAGLESFNYWKSSGVDADLLSMEILSEPVRANTWYLLGAGAIMAITLYFSRKARKVTDTQVNLSRQEEYEERFSPNPIARWLVKGVSNTANLTGKFLPESVKRGIGANFSTAEIKNGDNEVAFDLIRAAVNLTVASALIALGTSLKLPLSTTYVSFMVAMGTSLTDKAWGRETAVYRVAGVLNVIGGWFATAIVAFLMAGTFVLIMSLFGIDVGFILMILVGFIVIRGFVKFRKSEKAESLAKKGRLQRLSEISKDQFTQGILATMSSAQKAYSDAINGLIREDSRTLMSAYDQIGELQKTFGRAEGELYKLIRDTKPEKMENRGVLLNLFAKVQDLFQSAEDILEICKTHILNNHLPPGRQQTAFLKQLEGSMKDLAKVSMELSDGLAEKEKLEAVRKEFLNHQLFGIQQGEYGRINSSLVFRLVSESKDFSESLMELSALLNTLEERP